MYKVNPKYKGSTVILASGDAVVLQKTDRVTPLPGGRQKVIRAATKKDLQEIFERKNIAPTGGELKLVLKTKASGDSSKRDVQPKDKPGRDDDGKRKEAPNI